MGVHTSKDIKNISFPPMWNADKKEKKEKRAAG
jgi:hypothetical protein